MQKRLSRTQGSSPTPSHFSAEAWNLSAEFPMQVVDYRMTRTQLANFHVHNVLEIGLCRAGRGIFMIEDEAHAFGAGDVVVITSLEAHSAYSLPESTSEWTFAFVDPARIAGPAYSAELYDFSGGIRNLFRSSCGADQPCCQAVRCLIADFRDHPRYYRDSIRSHLSRIIIECKRSRKTKSVRKHSRSFDAMKALQPALQRISEDCSRQLDVRDLGRACHMSSSHFRRVFRAQFGSSPKEYLLAYRISLAAGLLSTTRKRISAIALESGFETLSSFNRQFLRRKSCSPRQWRAHASAAANS